MTIEFENDQVWLADLPKSETLEFTELLPKYKLLLNIQWAIFFALGLGLIGFAYFKFDDIDWIWFGVGLLVW